MEWQPDWGLRGRMALTMLLLTGLYIVFGVALFYVLGSLLPVILLIGGLSLVQYYYSDSLALRSMGARRVEREEYPQLYQLTERLAQRADVPVPDVAVAENATPNAFAAGRNQSNAVVCVTTGLLATLDEEELEGVIAHELAHVKNRDVAVMTIASFLSTVAFLVVRYGTWFGMGHRGGRGGRGAAGVFAAIIISLIVWIVSYFLIRALSRYREYAADRGAASLTGKPEALASALASISSEMDQHPTEDLREQAEMNAFFVVPITRGAIGRLASTHPPTEERIARLQALAG